MKTHRPMKILLVMPDADIHRLKVGPLCVSFREAPLTLTTLAALVPAELQAQIQIADESVDTVPWQEEFDLVGISCLTGTAPRAYAIADWFRARGVTTVLGGVHVSLRPEEARQHSDAIVIGFAEQTWPGLLVDFVHGRMQREYRGEDVRLSGLPDARRDLQRRLGYLMPNTIFATRGCTGRCSFCTVAAVPFGWHTRPVGEVIDEIRRLKGRRFVFSDVSLAEDRDYALELFNAMVPLKKEWGGLMTTDVAFDDGLLDVMTRSGCRYLLLGFESVDRNSLAGLRKRFNRAAEYKQVVQRLHDRNITVQGCFIFGMDHDQPTVFDATVQAVNDMHIDIPRFAILTPYPDTAVFRQLKREGRILHENWEQYDTRHVVFQPANMTTRELQEGFLHAHRETFKLRPVVQRTLHSCRPAITFLGNMAYRLYIRRLEKRAVRSSPVWTGDGGPPPFLIPAGDGRRQQGRKPT